MQKHLPSFSFLFICLLSLNFLACGKDEIIKDYSKFPIDFVVQQLPNGGYKYSWTGINTSDFKEYWIVKSIGNEVPFINENNPDLFINGSTTVIVKITDANRTEFVDTTSLFIGNSFVRVFAFLENRALSSLNKEVKGFDNLNETKGNAERVILDKKNNLFYIFDLNSRQVFPINAFTYTTESNFGLLSNIDLTKEIYLDDSEATSMLYFSEFQSSYTTVNLPKFDIRNGISLSFNSSSIAICRGKYLVFADNLSISSKDKKPFNFLNINTVSFAQTKNVQQPMLRWLKSQNQVIALSLSDTLSFLNSIGLDDNGFFLNNKKTYPLRLSSKNDITTPFIITPRELFALIDRQGLIMDLNTYKPVTTLVEKAKLTNVQYLDFTFSTDENFVYALRKSSVSTDKKIDVFTYPDFNYVKSLGYKSRPKRVFFHDNKIKLVGESPNNTSLTMFEVINP
jgi:hypothetical protein